jgi:ParB-like chromosome segregation protein Spo0J
MLPFFPEQIARIAASLVEYGWTAPVMVADDGEIIAGHGRLKAAQHLGLEEVPIIRLSHLTAAQVRACRIADNRLSELSNWHDELLAAELHAFNAAGFDLDLTGFDPEELDRLMAPLLRRGRQDVGSDSAPSRRAVRLCRQPRASTVVTRRRRAGKERMTSFSVSTARKKTNPPATITGHTETGTASVPNRRCSGGA